MFKQSVIPNKIFGAEFTLAIGCRLDCHYCPQEKLIHRYIDLYGKEDLFMKFDTFSACLKKIEPGAGIDFGGMVEPFHNKECAKMIKYAYDLGYKIWLDTTLVGASEDDFEILKDVDFNHVRLHLPDQKGNSKFVITDQYLKVFKKFHDHFASKGCLGEYSCHGEVHSAIKDYIKSDMHISNVMMNRAGNLDYDELRTYEHKGKIVCASGSDGNITGWSPDILPNGTVILCCMDYGMEYILGNLVTQEWNEILRGEAFSAYEEGLKNEKISSLCRKCPVGAPKDGKNFEYAKLLGSNAIRIARLIENYESKDYRGGVYSGYTEKDIHIIQLLEADNICLFGLGKLFEDNYYQSLWYNIVQANIFSDNRSELWGKTIHGIECVSPEELTKFQDLTVVTYVTNDSSIRQQLKELGIENIINIYEVYDLFN